MLLSIPDLGIRRVLYSPLERILPRRLIELRAAHRAQHDFRKAGVSFVHIPRTAGFSTIRTLYQTDDIRHFSVEQLLQVAADDVRRLPRFAIIRNPWDRLVSAYQFATQGGVAGAAQMLHRDRYRGPEFSDFATFVREFIGKTDVWKLDGVFRPQSYYLGRAGSDHFDHVGRFDRIADTEAWLSSTLDRPISLPKSNGTKRGAYQSYYTDELRSIVGRVYQDDIRRSGFEF